VYALQDSLEVEFQSLIDSHKRISPEVFNNDDDKYKMLTTEAIDSKSLLLKKRDLVLKHLSEQSEKGLVDVIRNTPFSDFIDPDVELRLITGAKKFPFADVLAKKEVIDLRQWNPAGLEEPQRCRLRILLEEANPKEIRLSDKSVDIPCRLMGSTLRFENIYSCEADVVAFLISTNTNLTELSLR
jgi:hypothetical protein